MRRPRWGHWPERGGHGPDARPFPDPNGQNADQTRVRLGRPVGVILSATILVVLYSPSHVWPRNIRTSVFNERLMLAREG